MGWFNSKIFVGFDKKDPILTLEIDYMCDFELFPCDPNSEEQVKSIEKCNKTIQQFLNQNKYKKNGKIRIRLGRPDDS